MRRVTSVLALLVLCLCFPSPGSAQSVPSKAGRRPLLPRDSEVVLARSAAPPSVSEHARVLVFADTGFVVAESGSNGVTCVVDRSWPASLEPHCFDAEASATILPIELRRTVLYHQGHSEAEVEREVADGLASGKFRLPRRLAMSYMMSDGQRLIGDDGTPAGHWRPHIMIYYPYLTNRDVGFGPTPDMKVGMVSEGEGGPMSSLVIIVPQFIPVASRAR
jgi:hypothetical protein